MQKPIYFDYLATTPVDPRVVEKMVACMSMEGNFGNPAIAGTGCGELNNMASQRIESTAVQCQFLMNSGVVGPPGLNGSFVLDMAGTFSNTSFQVGTGQLTGCNGTWTDATNTMSVTCGSCMITLTRR